MYVDHGRVHTREYFYRSRFIAFIKFSKAFLTPDRLEREKEGTSVSNAIILSINIY